ncbi:MAG: hypothetical protein H6622_03770 [Halobacteriovoraceae bacterium]|nr:hypothetical protein [Halobacteriovoraceae bacterium]
MKYNLLTNVTLSLLTLLVSCGGEKRQVDHSPRNVNQYTEQYLESLSYSEIEELQTLETLIGKDVRVSVRDENVFLETRQGVCEFKYPANLSQTKGIRGTYFSQGVRIKKNNIVEDFVINRINDISATLGGRVESSKDENTIELKDDSAAIKIEKRLCSEISLSVNSLKNFTQNTVVFSFSGFNIANPKIFTINPFEKFIISSPVKKMSTPLNIIYRSENRTISMSERLNSNDSDVRKFEKSFSNIPVEVSLQKVMWASYINTSTLSFNFQKGDKYFSAFGKFNTEEIFDRSLKLKFNYKARNYEVDGINTILFWNKFAKYDLEEVEVYLKQETLEAYMVGLSGEKITIKTDDEDLNATFILR